MAAFEETVRQSDIGGTVTWIDPGRLEGDATSAIALLAEVVDRIRNEADQPGASLRAIRDHLGATAAMLVRRGTGWDVIALADGNAPLGAVASEHQGLIAEACSREKVLAVDAEKERTLVIPLAERHCPNVVLILLFGAERREHVVEVAQTLARIRVVLSWIIRHLLEFRSLAAQVLDLRALLDVTRRLAAIRDTEHLLEAIASEAIQLLDAERASIFIWDRERAELIARPALGVEGKILRIPDEQGIVGAVLKSGQVEVVNDVAADPRFSDAVDRKLGFKTRNLIAVPLIDPRGRRLGVFEILNKREGGFTPRDRWLAERLAEQVAVVLQNAEERDRLTRVAAHYSEEVEASARIVGRSRAIVELRATVQRLARTELPVLVLGESGTGKEVVARAIHLQSRRCNGPFVAINCAALAETLLESELFGHERGAFTDARESRPGKFELAQGGTLFLDEIGDMSPAGQAKLLRVLEEKTIYRVGGTTPIPVDVRIIAATNRDLGDAVREGRFREDLYYRLSVVAVQIPPLRQRREDILELAEYFLERFCRDAGRPVLQLTESARRKLQEYSWPGNVRELRNVMERLAFLAPENVIDGEDIERILTSVGLRRDERGIGVPLGLSLSEATAEFQRRYIREAVRLAGGNVAEAGRRLGLHRSNLYRKIKQLGMDRDEFDGENAGLQGKG